MKTYQDLLECGGDEQRRMAFIKAAIAEHKRSDLYKTAVDAQLYYEGENPTITKYEKVLYDIKGLAHQDMYTANHKIKSQFFRIAVKQEYNYLLGNGVTLSDASKKKLGINFDNQVKKAAEYALIGGVSFGFWNLDHIDVFRITEFVPLYDEENGALMAGIRFWQVDNDKPLRCTLYEPDGLTEYLQPKGKRMKVMQKKRAYKLRVTATQVESTRIYNGENYPTFPIVPLKNNEKCRSEICGKRNTIDALDLVKSNMINNVDEGNIVYWALTNCCGMGEMEAAEFLQRVRTTHIAWVDNGDDGTTAEPHTIEAPYAGTQTAIDMLEKTLYTDFMAFDEHAVQAGNQTATAIRASYVPLDLKTDDFEGQVTEFLHGIFSLAGIDDEPTYTRNRITNQQEEMQTLMLAKPTFDEEYVTTKALTIMGDGDMVEEVLKRKAAEEIGRFEGAEAEGEQEGVADTEDAVDAAEETVGKTLNGSQTSSLITVIRQLGAGTITEGQAVNIITTALGVTREEALKIIRGEE